MGDLFAHFSESLPAATLLMLLVLVLARYQNSAVHRHQVLLWGLLVATCLPFVQNVLPKWRILPRWEATVSTLSPGSSSLLNPVAHLTPHIDWLIPIASIWAGGIIWMLLRILFHVSSLRRRQLETFDPECPRIAAISQECQSKTRRSGHVAVVMHPEYPMPMTWGFLKPQIWLPLEAEEWTDDELECVLLHELAHIERRDFLMELLTRIALAFYWFHPLAWSISRRMELEREMACDDRVLLAGKPAGDYAQSLARLGAGLKFPHVIPATAAGFFGRKPLLARVVGIADPWQTRASLTRNDIFTSATPIAVIAVMIGSLGFKAAAEIRNDRVHAAFDYPTEANTPSIWSDLIQPAVATLREVTDAAKPDESNTMAAIASPRSSVSTVIPFPKRESASAGKQVERYVRSPDERPSITVPATVENHSSFVEVPIPVVRGIPVRTRTTSNISSVVASNGTSSDQAVRGLPVNGKKTDAGDRNLAVVDGSNTKDASSAKQKKTAKGDDVVSIASTEASQSMKPRRMVASVQSGRSVATFDFMVEKSIPSDRLLAQTSSDLTTWQPAEELVVSKIRTTSDSDHDRISYRVAIKPGGARFYRISTELPTSPVSNRGLGISHDSGSRDREAVAPAETKPNSSIKKSNGK